MPLVGRAERQRQAGTLGHRGAADRHLTGVIRRQELEELFHGVGLTLPATRTLTPSANALIDKLVAEAGEVNRRLRPGSWGRDHRRSGQ
jgi:hypothetical protein